MVLDETRILVIDDDYDDFLVLKGLVKQIGSATIHLDYLEYVDSMEDLFHREYDLWLIDYRLGEKSGLDVIKEARGLGFDKPIIVMTGVNDEDLATKALRLGADEYLIKGQTTPHMLDRAVEYSLERKKAQERLVVAEAKRRAAEEGKRYEERFRKMIDHLKDYAIFMIDEEGLVTSWNLGAARLFGYMEGEILGRSYKVLFFEEEGLLTLSDRELRIAEREGSSASTLRGLRKGGKRFWADCVTTVMIDPVTKRKGFVKVVRDVTEKLESERALKESEEFNRSIFDSSPDRISVLNPDGMIISMNRGGLMLSGLDRPEDIEGSMWVDLWEGDDVIKAERALNMALHGMQGRFQGMSRRSARIIWWDVIVSPIIDDEGRVKQLVSVSRDVTGRKKLEEQKDEFIGIASHELKTPLTSVKAYAQVLEKRLQKSDDQKTVDLVQRLQGQLNKLAALVDDLLDVSRIEAGKLSLRREKLLLHEVFLEVREMTELAFRANPLEFLVDGELWIHGDRDRLSQVLINLISNAVKYSNPGDKIEIIARGVDAEVEIAVVDYGVGIAEDEIDRVFERFYRVESEQSKVAGGLGLGLFICADIVRRHGGKIWAESKEGKGTRILIRLPDYGDEIFEAGSRE